jgi:hypothetical protein
VFASGFEAGEDVRIDAALLPVGQPQFTELLDQCRSIEEIVNRATDYPTN